MITFVWCLVCYAYSDEDDVDDSGDDGQASSSSSASTSISARVSAARGAMVAKLMRKGLFHNVLPLLLQCKERLQQQPSSSSSSSSSASRASALKHCLRAVSTLLSTYGYAEELKTGVVSQQMVQELEFDLQRMEREDAQPPRPTKAFQGHTHTHKGKENSSPLQYVQTPARKGERGLGDSTRLVYV
jgi:hypothetical protein